MQPAALIVPWLSPPNSDNSINSAWQDLYRLIWRSRICSFECGVAWGRCCPNLVAKRWESIARSHFHFFCLFKEASLRSYKWIASPPWERRIIYVPSSRRQFSFKNLNIVAAFISITFGSNIGTLLYGLGGALEVNPFLKEDLLKVYEEGWGISLVSNMLSPRRNPFVC